MLTPSDQVRLNGMNLNSYSQITFVLIEKYTDLKAGEIWDEIRRELDHEGIQPLDVCNI